MYQVPIFKELEELNVPFVVAFGSDISLKPIYFDSIKTEFMPDTPGLIDGYKSKIFRNFGFESNSFLSRINPGVLREMVQGKYTHILIHGHDTITAILLVVVAKLFSIKTIWRGEIIPKRRSLLKSIYLYASLRLFDIHLYSCSGNLQFLNDLRLFPDSSRFIRCSVDNSYFSNSRKQLENNAAASDHARLSICFSGRFVERKRPFDLIEALEKVSCDLNVHWVGNGPLYDEMVDYTRESNHNHVFHGFLNQSQMAVVYNSCNLGVCCSSYDPSPKVVNEMLNFGVITIMTKMVGTCRDLSYCEADIIDVGDVEALADRLKFYAQNIHNLRSDIEKFCINKVELYSPKNNAITIHNCL
jgi:glycosyltransferase involved in cell wall biosynthesis